MTDIFKIELVRLAGDGSNWVSYRDRLQVTLRMRRWQEHLTATSVTQAYTNRGDVNGIAPPMRWEDDDEAVKHLIMNSISDKMFNRIKAGTNAKAWWDELKKICEGRSRDLRIDIDRKLRNTSCRDDDDVRAHFAKLTNYREQLASMGETISNEHFANTLLGSLPTCYDMRITAITTNADETGNPLVPEKIVKLITDDYDKRMLRKGTNSKTDDQAFTASTQKRDHRDLECFNCKKKGHIKANCWAKGGGKEGQRPQRKSAKSKEKEKSSDKDTAAIASDKNEDIESWAAIVAEEDLSSIGMPEIKSESDQDEISWTSEDTDEADSLLAEEGDLAQSTDDYESWALIESTSDDEDATFSEEITDTAASTTTSGDTPREAELYDSGASRHISPFRQRFTTYRPITPRPISTADKRIFYAVGIGDLHIEVPNGAKTTPILLKDTLHAPEIGLTVVSIGQIASSGHTVAFKGNECLIQNKKDIIIGKIPVSANGTYKVEHEYANAATLEQVDILTLHRRLGHISAEAIRNLIRANAVTGIQLLNPQSSFICNSCHYAKTTRKPISKERRSSPAQAFGDEIHSDLWGPSPVSTIGGRKYYVTFTDDYSRYSTLELLRSKDETFGAYKAYTAWAKTQHGAQIKRLRSDRGGEYTSNEFTKFLQEQGTERRLTTHDTPQHNGVAESLNRRLVERVRAILHHADLPKNLWGEAILFAVWLKNRTSTKALGNVTPYEKLYGNKPNLAGVPEWGQAVWVHSSQGSKLDARANEARWVGYDRDSTHAHRIYWPKKHSVSVERDIKFVPSTVSIYLPSISGTTRTLQPSQTIARQPAGITKPATPIAEPSSEETEAPQPPVATESGEEEMTDKEDEEVEDIITTPSPSAPVTRPTIASQLKSKLPFTGNKKKQKTTSEPARRSERIAERTASGSATRGRDMPGGHSTFRGFHPDFEGAVLSDPTSIEEQPYIEPELVASAIQEVQSEPKTINEARSRSDWPSWQAAMEKEMSTLERTMTWTSVPRPKGRNVVGSKWVFRIKRKSDGSVEKYKARLVARGFTQVYGEDYYDTFSPVAKLSSFRLIMGLAARFSWEIDSFDFTGAYLNGELDADEEIYMEEPPGYESQGVDTVKRLWKSLYGLKQAGRKWYEALVSALTDIGFQVTQADPGVFYMRQENRILILAVHVDDCILTGTSQTLIDVYKKKLHSRYELIDLGPVNWLLGIKITRNRAKKTISLSQKSYIDTILKRFGLEDAKAYATPMVPGTTYSKSDCPSTPAEADRMKKVPYRKAIGSLMYASVATRPDIAFAVSTLSQFLENPGELHWNAVKRIFRYLSGTRELELTYGEEYHDLVGYTDADGASQEHRHAISGYTFILDAGAVSWSSRKQELVTLSTTEAEYVAATHASKEALWLRKLIHELFPSMARPTTLYCDNQAALKLIEDDNYHARTKHIDVRYHFIRHIAKQGDIKTVYCPTDEMVGDILTKALPKWKVRFHSDLLGLRVVAHEGV